MPLELRKLRAFPVARMERIRRTSSSRAVHHGSIRSQCCPDRDHGGQIGGRRKKEARRKSAEADVWRPKKAPRWPVRAECTLCVLFVPGKPGADRDMLVAGASTSAGIAAQTADWFAKRSRRAVGDDKLGGIIAMQFLWFISIGVAAGWLAGQFMKGGGYGLVGDLIVGVIGAPSGAFSSGCSASRPAGCWGAWSRPRSVPSS